MNVLVIGADEITPIKAVLKDLGASNIEHWDARNENRDAYELFKPQHDEKDQRRSQKAQNPARMRQKKR